MTDFSKKSETIKYFNFIMQDLQQSKIKAIFSIAPMSWNHHRGYRTYSTDTEVYILLENEFCLVIDYRFIDALDIQFSWFVNVIENQFFKSGSLKFLNCLFRLIVSCFTNAHIIFLFKGDFWIVLKSPLQISCVKNAFIFLFKVIDAIEQQCASDLFFSILLGLKANLDNFIDPVARNFLDVDFDVYLREETAHRLPAYEQAQKVRDRFYSLLTPAQKEIYEDVITYNSHWETIGPKLAHYFGYILGNDLLPRVVPGYHSDMVLTIKYNAMLEDYFGKHFLPIEL